MSAIKEAFDWIQSRFAQVPMDIAPGDTIVLNQGQRLESLVHLAKEPLRRQAAIKTADLDSFAAYVTKYAEPDSVVFFNHEQGASAILDYIAPPAKLGEAFGGRETSWYGHRATMPLNCTTTYFRWANSLNQSFDQDVFACWLDGRDEIIQPRAADLIEIVSSLEETVEVRFQSKFNRQSGYRTFQYAAEGRTGTLKVPDKIIVRTKIYTCSPEPVDLELLLRYRVPKDPDANGLKFFYECPGLPAILEAESEAILEDLTQRLPDIPILTGTFSGPQ